MGSRERALSVLPARNGGGGGVVGKLGRAVLAWPWMKLVEPWVRVRSASKKNKSSEEEETEEEDMEEEEEEMAVMMRGVMGWRAAVELHLAAFVLVFGASGLVPAAEAWFVAFATVYALLLSCRCGFPPYPPPNPNLRSPPNPNLRSPPSLFLSLLFSASGILLGFFLPLAYALAGFSRSHPAPALSAFPFLFLTSSQLLSELALARLRSRFSPPVRVVLSLLYSARRLFALAHWMLQAFSPRHHHHHHHHPPEDALSASFGRCLAVANFIHCNITIFCILIPRLLLRAFERYIAAKNAYYASRNKQSARPTTAPAHDGLLEEPVQAMEIAQVKDDLDHKANLSLKRKGKAKVIQDDMDSQKPLRDVPTLTS